ncbi:tRNA adenosine(34) deaminase TadA [Diaphorobacter sp.]|uniref:tRNA adenosine(34) deaminase TadA n=1 Tax=Diaphorobacter sp. TaxID=1934310 RepID=UPI0028B0D025|nr:tRNA adenosine(34) deaminase TadA [Diaphorobacter sp.]
MHEEQSLIGQACSSDEQGMRLALAVAQEAAQAGEIPVGAVLVRQGRVIATGRNAPIAQHDPTAHAEIAALREAAGRLGNYRLDQCTLYVTLEPCAMCAGAMLHARLPRVVFGAADDKTGVAGSVLNLFAEPRLNHQTEIAGGVLAEECGEALSTFFRARRKQQRADFLAAHPLRDDALRTPDKAFADLPDYPWQPHYVSDLPALQGLRLHYLDEGPRDAQRTWLLLHGFPVWSYVFRQMIPTLLAAGDRVVAPDWIGFGKSDKPKKEAAHAPAWHVQVMHELVQRLDLRNVVLASHGATLALGLSVAQAIAPRRAGVWVLNGWSALEGDASPSPMHDWLASWARKPRLDMTAQIDPTHVTSAAWSAPFPDAGYRAGVRALATFSTLSSLPAASPIACPSLWMAGAEDALVDILSAQALQKQLLPQGRCIEVAALDHFISGHGADVAKRAVEYFTPF